MSIMILGIDLGKNSCSVVGVDATGAIVTRRTMRRQTLIDYITKLPACIVPMEACCGAHHLGRLFTGRGHEVRLMSPEYVRPYIKAQKNDDRDAEDIAEAASRPTMRFVDLKSRMSILAMGVLMRPYMLTQTDQNILIILLQTGRAIRFLSPLWKGLRGGFRPPLSYGRACAPARRRDLPVSSLPNCRPPARQNPRL